MSRSQFQSLSARSRVVALLSAAASCGLLIGMVAAIPVQATTRVMPWAAALKAIRVHPISVNGLNWSGHAGIGSRGPAWYTDSSGFVHLQGAVRQTSGSGPRAGLIGTLPRAARPPMFIYTITHTFGGTYSDLEITPDGRILRLGAHIPAVIDNSFLSLESITYKR